MSQPSTTANFPLDFPLHGTRLIEASAGTGKTFTIAALYVRLVLNHGNDNAFGRPLGPGDILVVTFTKAATEELRDRIRGNLALAARMFRGEAVDHPILPGLLKDYPPEQYPALARRLELAANSMDDAAIFTIHGWAQRMLRQHAFDSGQAFNTEIEEQLDQLWQEAARDYWRTFAYPLGAEAYQALVEVLGSPDKLALLARQFPASHYQTDGGCYQALSGWESRCQELEHRARDCWRREEALLVEWFESAVAEGRLNRRSHPDESVRQQVRDLCAWAIAEQPFDARQHGKLGSRNLKLKKGFEAPASEALTLIAELCDQQALPPQLAAALQGHAAGWCAQRVELQKQRRARMTFDDMLHQLDRALDSAGGPRLCETIRQHFPVALIDEFQDTDPEQYHIFREIYGNQPELGFFMIGDPKQAIYAFRGADIYTYLDARRHSAGHHYSLDTNFRSLPALVNGVNQLFQYAAQQPRGAFLLEDQIPFEPVASAPKEDRLEWNGQSVAGLTFWSRSDLALNNKDEYLAALAASCASHIRALLSAAASGEAGFTAPARPVQPSDIAILVRDFTEARQIRQALAQRGLASAYLSDRESVFSSAEAADLLVLLQAVAEPEREALIRTALASTTVNQDLSQLDIDNEDELAWEAQVEQFRHYKRLWQEQGVLPLVRHVLDDFEVPSGLLGQDDGERRLTNLLHLAELLQAQAGQLDGEQALVRFLADQLESGGRDLGDDAILRLESDDDLIKVVTFHKSKGLEYPLVYIPFAGLCKPLKKPRGPLISYHDPEGRQCYAPANDEEALAQADRERLAEDLRLLYVALTRPRFACWAGVLAYGQDTQSKGYSCKLRPSALAYVLSGGEPLPAADLWQSLEKLTAAAPDIQLAPLPQADDQALTADQSQVQPKAPRQRQGAQAQPWWITSYSAVLENATGSGEAGTTTGSQPAPIDAVDTSLAYENTAELRDEPPDLPGTGAGGGLHGLPRGAATGNFLHGILEWLAQQGFSSALESGRLASYLEDLCQRRGLEGWADPLRTHLQLLVSTPLEPGLPSLAELPQGSYRAELEFLFSVKHTDTARLEQLIRQAVLPGEPRPRLRPQTLNGMLKGYIDLVVEANGRYYVVDYKSNWLGETDRAYTREAMAGSVLEHRYDLQYTLYALALHRLLRSRLPDYDYERHFGGVLYLFLRGVSERGTGIYRDRPPRQLVDSLDRLFAGATEEHT